MKKRFGLFCAVALIALTVSAHGERPVEITVKPALGFTSGYTKFIMDLRTAFAPDLIGRVKSELEYPLGATLAGLQVGVGPRAGAKSEWGVEVSFLTNLNDPGHVMKDHDWLYVPGSIDAKIGYTESRSELTATQLALEASRAVWKSRTVSVGLLGGFRYQKFSENIFGYDGWYAQLDTNNAGLPIQVGVDTVHGQELALTYKVTYKMPLVGVYTRINPSANFSVTWKVGFAPVFAKDVDDHVLRNRVATSSGNGKAFITGLRASVRPFKGTRLAHTFIQTDLDYISLTVKSTGDQRWYGDDPASEGYDDTGTRITLIPHNFYSRQLTAAIRAGIAF